MKITAIQQCLLLRDAQPQEAPLSNLSTRSHHQEEVAPPDSRRSAALSVAGRLGGGGLLPSFTGVSTKKSPYLLFATQKVLNSRKSGSESGGKLSTPYLIQRAVLMEKSPPKIDELFAGSPQMSMVLPIELKLITFCWHC